MPAKLVKLQVTLTNKWGLHARSSYALAALARSFSAAITVTRGGARADAKKMDELLALAVEPGAQMELTAVGPDEERAAAALVELIASKFGEKE